MKKKVLIIGTMNGTILNSSKNFQKDISTFLTDSKPTIVDFIPTFDLLIKTVEDNPDSMIMYCPTRIPKKVKAQLNSCKFLKELLEEKNVSIGYIKLNGFLIEKKVICFDKRGKVESKIFPRKKKTNYYRKVS